MNNAQRSGDLATRMITWMEEQPECMAKDENAYLTARGALAILLYSFSRRNIEVAVQVMQAVERDTDFFMKIMNKNVPP